VRASRAPIAPTRRTPFRQALLREQLRGDRAAEIAAALGERERRIGLPREPELLDACEAGRIERVLDSGEQQRLIEAEPQHHARARPGVSVDRLVPPFRSVPRRERREVARELRLVPPAPALDCADRADPEAEVVVAEPVAEVVPRAEVTLSVDAAEVGRLVP